MSLLDHVLRNNTPDYAKGGRHVVRLTRAYMRDPTEDPSVTKPGGGFDGEVLHSSRSDTPKGRTIRANASFRFPDSDLPRMRKGAAACMTSKTATAINEMNFNLVQAAGEEDKAYQGRIIAEVKRIFGPEQPAAGAIVVFNCTERKGRGGDLRPDGSPNVYTLFQIEIPNEADLKNAGLLG